MNHPASRPEPQDPTVHDTWRQALSTALEDAIAHLQVVIFEEGWETIRAATTSDADALRESARQYERGLAGLFELLRVAGAPESPAAWSAFKAGLRQAARDADTEITLRTALENALYSAERAPLGDHERYRAWVSALTAFLGRQVDGDTPRPPGRRPDEQLEWAYSLLAPLEDHAVFHTAFAAFLAERGTHAPFDGRPVEEVAAHQALLRRAPRFDLVMNAGLLWLAGVTDDQG